MDEENTLGVVIICASTGVICTAQVGGHWCNSPEIEGYPIYLRPSSFEVDRTDLDSIIACFNDCSWGCGINNQLFNDEKYRLDYATAIDKFLKESINTPARDGKPRIDPDLFFSFDYERVEEVVEGWWPVLVQFKKKWDCLDYDEDYNPHHDKKFKGYLYLGNCD